MQEEVLKLLSKANTYGEFVHIAECIDSSRKAQDWQAQPESPNYDFGLVQSRLNQLKQAREENDIGRMIFLLRGSLNRNFGNIGLRRNYYEPCLLGTKTLIQEFIQEVVRDLNWLADDVEEKDWMPPLLSPPLSPEDCGKTLGGLKSGEDLRYDFFVNSRRVYGRTALLLSGGASFGTFLLVWCDLGG